MPLSNSRNASAFFCTTVVMACLVMGIEAYIFARFEIEIHNLKVVDAGSKSRAIPTYFALFLFAHISGVVLAWDSLRLKNTIQVIGLCLYHLALMLYAVVQIEQIKVALGPTLLNDPRVWGTNSGGSIQPWLLVIPLVIGVCVVLMSYFAYRLYEEMGWTIYKHIGADVVLRRRYMAYQIFVTLLKFDFIFFVGFTIQFAVIILDSSDPEFALTVAVIPVTILGLIFTFWALRNEKRWGMLLTLAYFLCALAYFLFKLVRMYWGPKKSMYGRAKRPLASFAILTLVLLIVSIANAWICMRNFGNGLRNYVRQRQGSTNPGSPEVLMDQWHHGKEFGQSMVNQRLELD